MITTSKYKTGGTQVFANGEMVCILTEETPAAAVARFVVLCEANADELCKVIAAKHAKIRWNHANRGKGKDWPEFRQCEKVVNRLLAQAGIKDS